MNALAQSLKSRWGAEIPLIDLQGKANDPNFKIKPSPIPCIAIADSLSPDLILNVLLHGGISHIIQTHGIEFEKELETSCRMICSQSSFLDFPISSVLSPSESGQTKENEFCLLDLGFSGAFEKNKILDDIRITIDPLSKSGSIKTEVLTIADELITNAIFNAPFVDKKNNNAGINREDESTSMSAGKSGRVIVGSDSSRVFIGCYDPYGSLNLNALFDRILKVYTTGVAQNINMGAGGAGIGSYMIFNASVSYYAVVKHGQLTMICCTVPLRMSSKQRIECPKNVHYMALREAR